MQNQPETDERITRDFWVEEQHNQAGIPDKKQIRNSMKTKQNKTKKRKREMRSKTLIYTTFSDIFLLCILRCQMN